ncbi:hypothetical protein AB1N83_008200 [Pleurotus pulmonarius]
MIQLIHYPAKVVPKSFLPRHFQAVYVIVGECKVRLMSGDLISEETADANQASLAALLVHVMFNSATNFSATGPGICPEIMDVRWPFFDISAKLENAAQVTLRFETLHKL